MSGLTRAMRTVQSSHPAVLRRTARVKIRKDTMTMQSDTVTHETIRSSVPRFAVGGIRLVDEDIANWFTSLHRDVREHVKGTKNKRTSADF